MPFGDVDGGEDSARVGSPWGPPGRERPGCPALPSPTLPSPQLIYMHWMNTVVNYCGPFEYEVGYCERLKSFLEANLEWMQEQMDLNQDSAYWHQVGAAALLSGIGPWDVWASGTCHCCRCCPSTWPLAHPLSLWASPLVCPWSPIPPADLPFIHLSNLHLSLLPCIHSMALQPSILAHRPLQPILPALCQRINEDRSFIVSTLFYLHTREMA